MRRGNYRTTTGARADWAGGVDSGLSLNPYAARMGNRQQSQPGPLLWRRRDCSLGRHERESNAPAEHAEIWIQH